MPHAFPTMRSTHIKMECHIFGYFGNILTTSLKKETHLVGNDADSDEAFTP